MDDGTGLTILGTAIGSAKTVEKILGPTADYIGEGLRDWTKHRVENLGKIFKNAERKLGKEINKSGKVPPKVLKGVLNEGAYCDDELGAEYFGGVLASSRTEINRDDRGITFTSLLGRLSTYQIRSHYFFYTILREIYKGLDCNVADSSGRNELQTYIPYVSYLAAMDFSKDEDASNILSHVMFGLDRESLITNSFAYGSTEHLEKLYDKVEGPGIVFTPSALGVELYLWAHGNGELPLNSLLDDSYKFSSSISVNTAPGIRSIKHQDRGFPRSNNEST